MRSVIAVSLCALVLGSFSVGCTVITSDAPLDSGVTADGGDDTTPSDDTGTVTDTGVDDVSPDAPAGPAVIIKAQDLISSSTSDDFHDFGGGSTKNDIVNGRLAYAVAKYGTVESSYIGASTTGYVDGRLVGLPTGSELTIEVTGYLRGLNGNDDATPNTRIPWATTTCKATPSATADVVATCDKLALKTDLKGVVVSSDVLPPGWCTGKGATTFDRLRARTPFTGTAVVSKTVDDCLGVVWIPFTEYSAAEDSSGKSEWSLSLETKDSGTACTLTAPCKVDRMVGTASETDIYVIGDACRLNDTTAPRTPSCF